MKRFYKQILLFAMALAFSFGLYATDTENDCTCCEYLRLNSVTLSGDDYVSYLGNYTIEEIQARRNAGKGFYQYLQVTCLISGGAKNISRFKIVVDKKM